MRENFRKHMGILGDETDRQTEPYTDKLSASDHYTLRIVSTSSNAFFVRSSVVFSFYGVHSSAERCHLSTKTMYFYLHQGLVVLMHRFTVAASCFSQASNTPNLGNKTLCFSSLAVWCCQFLSQLLNLHLRRSWTRRRSWHGGWWSNIWGNGC